MTCLRHVRAAMTEPQREPSEPLDPKAATNRPFTKSYNILPCKGVAFLRKL